MFQPAPFLKTANTIFEATIEPLVLFIWRAAPFSQSQLMTHSEEIDLHLAVLHAITKPGERLTVEGIAEVS